MEGWQPVCQRAIGYVVVTSDESYWRTAAKVEEIESYALNISEADLNNALKNDSDDGKKTEKKAKNKEDLADYQLTRALDLVKALALYSKTDK